MRGGGSDSNSSSTPSLIILDTSGSPKASQFSLNREERATSSFSPPWLRKNYPGTLISLRFWRLTRQLSWDSSLRKPSSSHGNLPPTPLLASGRLICSARRGRTRTPGLLGHPVDGAISGVEEEIPEGIRKGTEEVLSTEIRVSQEPLRRRGDGVTR